MMWSIIRIGIFTSAFVVGALSSRPVDANVVHLDENSGTLLVVACDEGRLVVTQLTAGGVLLNCLRSGMPAVGDEEERPKEIPAHRSPVQPVARLFTN